jgi:glycosyltransferase involved in cell wall biosynthesis
VDFCPEAPEDIRRLAESLGARWKVNLHDYKVICPRINLADESGLYCGEPDESECNRCLKQQGSSFNVFNIREWRLSHEQGLIAADQVLVPDQDMAERMARYFSDVNFVVAPHEKDISSGKDNHSIQLPSLVAGQRLRIVIIGAIGKLKGFHVIMACAKQAKQQQLPLDFIVMGYTMNDKLVEEAGVQVTGKYHEHEAMDKLNALAPHVIWLPSLWPETYSYTLSIAIKANLPVFAFDIGAIARRIKEIYSADSSLMPLTWHDQPAKINQRFEQFRNDCLPPSDTHTLKIIAD